MSDDESTEPAPVTGDPEVDMALTRLAGIEDEALDRHIEIGEAVHGTLRGRLGGLGGA
ncbi:MAG: hypothetical protein L0H79_00400 [Intrasporangium sp.]|uniref:hypothetical protein n=1 Tax=Intrasporangium sp. TaxID=1925024 RepID=UPI002647BEBD|nr:hypothetical protein [Intrasporangium sp.]MDN5794193.1 hypothetical protein [Intrasporangium sp.]